MFRNKNKTLDIEHMLVRHGNLRTLLWQIFFFRGRKLKGTMTSSVSCREVEFMPKEKHS